MQTKKLANLTVSNIGFGTMGMNHGYGNAIERNKAIGIIRQAYNLGCTFFDSAEGYMDGANEKLLGDTLKPVRKNTVIATKFGGLHVVNGNVVPYELKAKEIRQHCEASLKRLNTDYIDLYFQHRVSKEVPVEEVAGCMGELIQEGKILGWGMSMPTAEDIRRGHAVTPITAIESEYSIMERSVEKDILPICEELGIGFVAFSPLASGFLTGAVHPSDYYPKNDIRSVISRFKKENMIANQPLIDLMLRLSEEKQATPSQIALSWLLYNKDYVLPIPGTRNFKHLKENLQASDIHLTCEEIQQMNSALETITIHGSRTDEEIVLGLDWNF